MGQIYLIVFILAEIALVVLTFTKFNEKSKWLKNRAIIRAAEALIMAGIIFAPGVYLKWRFIGAAIVLAIRFIFDSIMWLIKRNKAEGNKKKGWSVVNCVASVLVISTSLFPAFIFSNYNGLETTGRYKVNEVSAILVDKNRVDEFETDGSFREVPAHFYYPENGEGKYPLVIFSHGAFGYYQSNFSTYAELASNGYVVVALDHPHHSFFTKDTDRNIITVDTDFINDVMKINENTSDENVYKLSRAWLKLRSDDENFVLDSIKAAKESGKLESFWNTEESDKINNVLNETDTDKIGLIGHSLGGATSVELGRERDDIDAVVDLDGTMLGEYTGIKDGKRVNNEEPYPVPVLDFTKESDNEEREKYKKEHEYPYANDYLIDNAKDGKTVTFSGVEHMDFTDLPLISPSIASMLGSGDVDHEKTMTTINGIVLNWFDYYLKNEGKLDIQDNY